ncbi:hypothetical protein G9A89_014657 [Geosiphon pyriformis]|nr:hypothetical protein G9A89_014657 [Geosiphon pyriformis]
MDYKNGQTTDKKRWVTDSAIDGNDHSFVIIDQNVINLEKFTSNIKNMLSSILTAANPNCIINKGASSKKRKKSSPRFSTTTSRNKMRIDSVFTHALLIFDFTQQRVIKYISQKRGENLSLVQSIMYTITIHQTKVHHNSVGTISINTTKKSNESVTYLNPD